jgi:uncharacterized protein YdhG (YjbR/CyaY superfamily)
MPSNLLHRLPAKAYRWQIRSPQDSEICVSQRKAGMAAKKPSSETGKFSAEERAAMKERQRELKAEKEGADGEAAVQAKIAEMPPADREMAERIHVIVKEAAPELTARTFYGMPAYARNGKVVCFFQSGAKFKTRYSTLGFSDKAALDDGAMWPTGFALAEMTRDVEKRIAELVRRAIR